MKIIVVIILLLLSCNQVVRPDCNEAYYRCVKNCTVFENQQQLEACQDICNEINEDCKKQK
jgi:hypothetical protein